MQVEDVRRLPDLLRQAFRVATSSPSAPAHLELDTITGTMLDGAVDDAGPLAEPRFMRIPAGRSLAEVEAIHDALQVLVGAQRPVIVAGGGVRWSGAEEEVREFAALLGIPVATSMNAKGTISETDELAVGVVGSYSRAPANQTFNAADVVFFIGSHTGSQVTDNWRLPAPGTTVIQLDVDERELGRNYPNAVSLCGDAKRTLAEMIDEARSGRVVQSAPLRQEWRDTVAAFVADWRTGHEHLFTSPAVPMRPERICRAITEALPDDGVLVVDTGHAGIWSAMIDLRPGQTFLRCAGSLGWAFPAALGARAALPDRTVVCLTGDGGFYYHIGELETAARHDLDAVIVVNNNRSLSQDKRPFAQGWGGEQTEGRDRMWMFKDLDLSQVARDLGCEAVRVEDPSKVQSAIKDAMGAGVPLSST